MPRDDCGRVCLLENTPENVRSVLLLERRCFGADAWTEQSVKSEFANTFSVFFAYIVQDVVVGYVAVRCIAEEMQVCSVAVLPEFRRRGVGTTLLGQAEAFAKKAGCLVAELEVNEANAPAIALYEKRGYVRRGVRKNYYPKNEVCRDAYTMVKEL